MDRTKIIIILGILLILGVGGMLRFWGLPYQGFFFQDEAVMFSRAETLRLHLVEQDPVVWKTQGYVDSKILWLVFLITGQWLTDGAQHTPMMVSAIFGILTVILTFLFARRYFGTMDVAFLSALFLSLSSYHVFYSRLGLPETAGMFFYLLAIYLYLKGINRHRGLIVLSGVIAGCAFLINRYRIMTLPLVILLIQIFLSGKNQSLKKSFYQFTIFFLLAGFTVLAYQALHNLLALGDIYIPSYFYGFKKSLSTHQFVMPDLYSWLSFPLFIYSYEGIGISILLLIGLFFYFKDERIQLPVFVVILGILICSMPDEKVARSFSVYLPFVAMVSARSFLNMFEWLGGRRILRLLLSVFLIYTLATGYIKSREISRCRTDMKHAVEHLIRVYDNPKFVMFNPVANLYSINAQRILSTEQGYYDVYKFYYYGYNHIIIDPYARLAGWTYSDFNVTDSIQNFIEDIEENCDAHYAAANFSDELMKRYIFEHNRKLRMTQSWLNSVDDKFGKIIIYSLYSCAGVKENIKTNPEEPPQ